MTTRVLDDDRLDLELATAHGRLPTGRFAGDLIQEWLLKKKTPGMAAILTIINWLSFFMINVLGSSSSMTAWQAGLRQLQRCS